MILFKSNTLCKSNRTKRMNFYLPALFEGIESEFMDLTSNLFYSQLIYHKVFLVSHIKTRQKSHYIKWTNSNPSKDRKKTNYADTKTLNICNSKCFYLEENYRLLPACTILSHTIFVQSIPAHIILARTIPYNTMTTHTILANIIIL